MSAGSLGQEQRREAGVVKMPADSTVRSQDSGGSAESKGSLSAKGSESTAALSSLKPDSGSSCLAESKHSKDELIPTEPDPRGHHHHHHHHQHPQQQPRHHHHHHHHQQQHQQHHQQQQDQQQKQLAAEERSRDEANTLMFTSCGQLLLGVVLVTFGVLVLVNGASLGGSGAGLWAGAAALAAGALGLVASLASARDDGDADPAAAERRSGFSSAHLAASLVALALANLAAITALTAVVRDSQRPLPDLALLTLSDGSEELAPEEGWSGLLASIGLLVASVAELLVAGYTSVILAPKLCDCLRGGAGLRAAYPDEIVALDAGGKAQLKTRNMVQQWVIAQSPGSPAKQPFYIVQPILQPVHPALVQTPYGMVGPAGAGAVSPGKFAAAGYLPGGPLPILPAHLAPYPPPINRPPSHHMRSKQRQQQQQRRRRHSSERSGSGEAQESSARPSRSPSGSPEAGAGAGQRRSASRGGRRKTPGSGPLGDDQLDLARTYTGLDKRISEEFISIAMDPERKSRASSQHDSDVAPAAGAH